MVRSPFPTIAMRAMRNQIVEIVRDRKRREDRDQIDDPGLKRKKEPIVANLAAQGVSVGKSLCEHDLADTAREILDIAAKNNCRILLPADVAVATEFKAHAPDHRICHVGEVADNEMILDAGPQTLVALEHAMDEAKTLVWNGPLGAFELEPFDTATVAAAQAAAHRAKAGKLTAVAGGGDTVAALNHAKAADDFTFVSTAGGAFLEWMEGKELPGVEALKA